MLLRGSTSGTKQKWRNDPAAQLINKSYCIWESQQIIAKKIVVVRWEQSQRAFAYELKSSYLGSTIESWKDADSTAFSDAGYVYFPSSDFPSWALSIPSLFHSVLWNPGFTADKLYTFGLSTECSTMTPPSIQNSQGKIKLVILVSLSSFQLVITYTFPLFTCSIKILTPDVPLARYAA